MSLQSWTEEFYPIPIDECKEEDALGHSLRKWVGFLRKNLKKHKVIIKEDPLGYVSIYQKDVNLYIPIIYKDTCALCKFYSKNNGQYCPSCPIVTEVTGTSCNDIWQRMSLGHNPKPMIRLLRKVKKVIEKKGKNNA